jgi:small subunit ribosomal protein S6
LTEYEILLLLDPDMSEERQTEIVTRIRETVERDGSWDRHDVWGRRKLAYEIDHKPEGFYHLLLFSSSAETLDEITRVLRITDGVLRHLAVRRLKASSAAEPQAAPARAEEPEAEATTEPAAEPEAETPTEPTAEPDAEPEVVQEAG